MEETKKKSLCEVIRIIVLSLFFSLIITFIIYLLLNNPYFLKPGSLRVSVYCMFLTFPTLTNVFFEVILSRIGISLGENFYYAVSLAAYFILFFLVFSLPKKNKYYAKKVMILLLFFFVLFLISGVLMPYL